MEDNPSLMVFKDPEKAAPISLEGSHLGAGFNFGGKKVWFCAECGRVRIASDLWRLIEANKNGLKPNAFFGFESNEAYQKIPYDVPDKWDFIKYLKNANVDFYFLLCSECIESTKERYPKEDIEIYEKKKE